MAANLLTSSGDTEGLDSGVDAAVVIGIVVVPFTFGTTWPALEVMWNEKVMIWCFQHSIVHGVQFEKEESSLVNFHLGWLPKKAPHKSQKNSVFPAFMKDFGTCRGFFGGPTQVEN